MQKYTIKNGITTMYYQIPCAVSVSFGLYVKAGHMYESIENMGITHFLEHMHFRRLGNFLQNELYYKTEAMGCQLRASTYKEMIRFYIKARPSYLLECASIFKDIITTYNWTKKDIEQERLVLLNELYEKASYLNIADYINNTIWKDSTLAYPIIGTESSIKSISLKDIIKYKKSCFSKNNIFLIVTGNIKDSDILSINEIMETINLPKNKHKKDEVKSICQISSQFHRKPDIFFKNCTWNYLDLSISFDIDKSCVTYEELTFLSALLALGDGAILPQIIREDMGFTYDLHSVVDYFKDAACLKLNLSIDKNNLCDGIKKIFTVLKQVKSKIDECEYKKTIPFYTDNLWFWLEDPNQINFEIAWHTLICDDKGFDIGKQIKKYKNITLNRLRELCKIIFIPENLSIAVIGATNNISKKSIRKLAKHLND